MEIIGVPAVGTVALAPTERALLEVAEVVVSSPRLLAGITDADCPRAELVEWPRPLLAGLDALLDRVAGRRVVVLASGDPLVSGIGTTLLRRLGASAVRIHPAVSSVALAGARMGWDAAELAWVSLVTSPAETVGRFLVPRGKVLCLSRDETTPGRLAALLVERGLGATEMTVLGNLGAGSESRFDCVASRFTGSVPRLNIVALALPDESDHLVDATSRRGAMLGSAPGLPDGAFGGDGQVTKREVRAAALGALRPTPGALLWDLGAGSGSISIEWCLHHPSSRAIAVERDVSRADLVRRNAHEFGVAVDVVEAEIDRALPGLVGGEAPDAVFVGGGADEDVIDRSYAALRPGGRLVAHAVTLETEAVLVSAYRRLRERAAGAGLRRITVESAQPLGRYLSWTPARAVVQLSLVKEN